MRPLLAPALAALAIAGSAQAESPHAAPTVEVTISPELRQKAEQEYGVRDVERLVADLQQKTEREMQRSGVLAGGRIELTLVDATPNRPTFKQLGDTPGLSMSSFGVGGAEIEGKAVSIDGDVTPIRYRWYETDIRNASRTTTWSDAQYAINRFAVQLSLGKAYARR
ncbi:MAG TPA: hypothetical protein VIP08_04150 [Phenylobacterium sp.]|uniref:hypothetical protein n=1 Tax=Phenylobacterium sp. TaxID=1871053 RepID=UPI002F930756